VLRIRNSRAPAAALLVSLFLALVSASPTAAAAPAPAVGRAAAAGSDGVDQREVSFADGSVTLHGTVFAPADHTVRHPALVVVHGAGPGPRSSQYQGEALALARAGIVVLVYDKRTQGYDLLHRDFTALADDALAGVGLLHGLSDVDPARVGVYGFSEGGWVAPQVAVRSADIAFLITVGGNGVSPIRAQSWSYGEHLTHAGVTGSMREMEQVTGPALLSALSLFPEADYDPVPWLSRVRVPVLAVWGEHDRQTPPADAYRTYRQVFGSRATLRVVPGANHALRRSTDGFAHTAEFAPGFLDLVADWVLHGPDGRSDPEPAQPTAIPSVGGSPGWFGSPVVQLALIAFFLLVFAGYGITALVPKLRQRSATSGPARLVVCAGSLAALGWFSYLGYLGATGGAALGPVWFGRTPAWLALHLAALTVVVGTVWFALSWWRSPGRLAVPRSRSRREPWVSSSRSRREPGVSWRRGRRGSRASAPGAARRPVGRWAVVRQGSVLVAGVLFLPWALHWGLLMP
jgi:dienelactone hydrolase